ncbi:MAG: hypothetical protein ABIV47_00920 [Roseiflexaceae bacterium]
MPSISANAQHFGRARRCIGALISLAFGALLFVFAPWVRKLE